MAIITLPLSKCMVKKTEKLNGAANDILNEKFNSRLVIPVTINNKLYQFLIDTGASLTVINEEIAKEITQEVSCSTLHPFHKEIFSNFNIIHVLINIKNLKFIKPVSIFLVKKESVITKYGL